MELRYFIDLLEGLAEEHGDLTKVHMLTDCKILPISRPELLTEEDLPTIYKIKGSKIILLQKKCATKMEIKRMKIGTLSSHPELPDYLHGDDVYWFVSTNAWDESTQLYVDIFYYKFDDIFKNIKFLKDAFKETILTQNDFDILRILLADIERRDEDAKAARLIYARKLIEDRSLIKEKENTDDNSIEGKI